MEISGAALEGEQTCLYRMAVGEFAVQVHGFEPVVIINSGNDVHVVQLVAKEFGGISCGRLLAQIGKTQVVLAALNFEMVGIFFGYRGPLHLDKAVVHRDGFQAAQGDRKNDRAGCYAEFRKSIGKAIEGRAVQAHRGGSALAGSAANGVVFGDEPHRLRREIVVLWPDPDFVVAHAAGGESSKFHSP